MGWTKNAMVLYLQTAMVVDEDTRIGYAVTEEAYLDAFISAFLQAISSPNLL